MNSPTEESAELPAGLVGTFSLAWTGDELSPGLKAKLEHNEASESYFDACYRCGVSFVFNPSFPLHPGSSKERFFSPRTGHKYLGFTHFTPSEGIGECRYDFVSLVFDDLDGIKTHLLQIHFKPLAAEYNCEPGLISEIIRYTKNFTPGSGLDHSSTSSQDDSSVSDLAKFFWSEALSKRRTGSSRTSRKIRKYSVSYSYFVLFSAYDLAVDRFRSMRSDDNEYFKEIYRLLYLQAGGVKRSAQDEAQKTGWSSTDFFEAWHQPGGMVVLSTRHSSTYGEDVGKFYASGLDTPSGDIPEISVASDAAESYDSLPEYPAFRYVTPLIALYGLLYEEVLRDTYERLLELQDEAYRGNLFSNFFVLLGRNREIGQLTRRLARIDSLEHLRLPVSRPIGEQIIQSKLQTQVARSIDQMRATNISTAIITLSLVSVSVAFLALANALANAVFG